MMNKTLLIKPFVCLGIAGIHVMAIAAVFQVDETRMTVGETGHVIQAFTVAAAKPIVSMVSPTVLNTQINDQVAAKPIEIRSAIQSKTKPIVQVSKPLRDNDTSIMAAKTSSLKQNTFQSEIVLKEKKNQPVTTAKVTQSKQQQNPSHTASAQQTQSVEAIREIERDKNVSTTLTNAMLSISEVSYVKKINPQYPRASQNLREKGTVILVLSVNEKGQPVQVEISKSSGYKRLDEAAMQAAQRSRFKPYQKNGSASSFRVKVPIEFKL